jgi:hypothetical protein
LGFNGVVLPKERLAALASDRRQTPLRQADQKHRVLWSTSAARGSFALVPSNDLKQPGRSVSEPYGTVPGDRMVADVWLQMLWMPVPSRCDGHHKMAGSAPMSGHGTSATSGDVRFRAAVERQADIGHA